MKDKEEIRESVMRTRTAMTGKYNSLKKEIIASFGELAENGCGRFPKGMRVKVGLVGEEKKITFTGLKVIDGIVWFENNRTKVLYDCDTVSVDELMKVLDEFGKQL